MAERALEILRSADSFLDAEMAWTSFLAASNVIYNKIEKGAAMTGKEGYWRGRTKHVRRKNACSRYVHHARNSDEHGIDDVFDRHSTMYIYPLDPEKPDEEQFGWAIQHCDDDITLTLTQEYQGKKRDILPIASRKILRLRRVYDDVFKDWFDPPLCREYDKDVEPEAYLVALQEIAILRRLAEEASALPVTVLE